MLLEFADRLRVVVATANLVQRSWHRRGEAFWVQDFPRAAGAAGNDAGRLLAAGPFALRLGHFVADLLTGAPRSQRARWTERLATFDFSQAAAELIVSLPSAFCRARSALPPGAVALRLPLASPTPQGVGLAACRLTWGTEGWELLGRASGGEEAGLERLRGEQAQALRAAAALGLRVRPEVELLASGWGGEAATPEDDCESSPQSWSPGELTARVVAEGDCTGRWADADDIAALLRSLEVSYGLFALEEALAGGEWRQSEERHYAAITGSLGWLSDQWRDDFDRLVGRSLIRGEPGPAVVVPKKDPLQRAHLRPAAVCSSAGKGGQGGRYFGMCPWPSSRFPVTLRNLPWRGLHGPLRSHTALPSFQDPHKT